MHAALLVILFALLAPHAAAGEEQRTTVGEVDITARYAWPEAVYGGYFPFRMELVNTGAADVEVEVEAQNRRRSASTEKRVRLAAGERYAFDLLCIGHAGQSDAYDITCRVGGEEALFQGMGPVDRSHGNRQVILLVTPEVPLPGTRERWEQSLGQSAYHVGDVRFEHLAERFEAYSSVDVVALDVSRGLPPEASLEPILRWARLGGTLVLFGVDASRVARGAEALSPWLEARFRVADTEGGGLEAWSFGHGRLACIDASDLLADGPRELLVDQMSGELAAAGWVPRPSGTRARRHAPVEDPMNPLPLRTLAAMLVLFALLIGPVNFVMVKKLGKPSLLLLTVPAIALLASVGLLAYGVLHQGLSVKVVTKSLTLLDQRARRATTIELRNLFAGSSPGPGLRPAEGTACFLNSVERARDERLSVDLTDGTLLGADFLPVRRPVQQVLHTDRVARARLELTSPDGGLVVTNGLGARVERLVLRAPDGSFHRLLQPLEDGAGASLVPLASASDPELFGTSNMMSGEVLGSWRDTQPPGTYLAILAESPFTDDCGVELRALAAEHAVLGVFDAGPLESGLLETGGGERR